MRILADPPAYLHIHALVVLSFFVTVLLTALVTRVRIVGVVDKGYEVKRGLDHDRGYVFQGQGGTGGILRLDAES